MVGGNSGDDNQEFQRCSLSVHPTFRSMCDSIKHQSLRVAKQTLKHLQHVIRTLDEYCDKLPIFGFNSSRYDLNLIKEYLIPYLVEDKKEEDLQVIKKANQYVSLKVGNLVFMDILNFLGGCTSLDGFLKAYKTSESKGFFPYEWLDSFDKLVTTMELPPKEAFHSKLKGINVLAADYLPITNYLQKNPGKNEIDALIALKLNDSPPPSEQDNYNYLQSVWINNNMTCMKDFLQWYNNKDVVPTREALTRMMQFYHDRGVDVFKCGCTLPSIANRILHGSTKALFHPFAQKDEDLAENLRTNVVGGPSIVFTRYAKNGETKIRLNGEKKCQTIVGVDASQLYPYAMTQRMPSGPYVRWELTEDGQYFKCEKNWRSELEKQVLAYIQYVRPKCFIRTIFNSGTQKRIGGYLVDGFCSCCQTVYEVMGCYWHACECRNLEGEELDKAIDRRRFDEEKEKFFKDSGFNYNIIKECQWKRELKENHILRDFIRDTFPYKKRELSVEAVEMKIINGTLFGYIECDMYVPEELRHKFENFPPIFKNTEVSRSDIGPFMAELAEEQGYLKRPRRMLISSFKLEKGILITPLVQYYLKLGLKLAKVYQIIEYPEAAFAFKDFVNSVVQARREGDYNPQSSVVAETMKLIGNSSYGYQIMNRSKQTNTRYVNEDMVNVLINKKHFKDYNQLNESTFEVQSTKSKIVHKEPIVVGFFILQYAKLRMLELYYNFLTKYCDDSLYEEIEMDTDSLYMALAVDNIDDLITDPVKKEAWERLRSLDCRDNFEADSDNNFFPRTCCDKHIQFDKRAPGLFKEEFRGSEMVALCSKTYCVKNDPVGKTKFSCKGLNKRVISNDPEAEPISKFRKVMDSRLNCTSENRGFQVKNNSIQTYLQTKRGLCYFYPKRIVNTDGIHTTPLLL